VTKITLLLGVPDSQKKEDDMDNIGRGVMRAKHIGSSIYARCELGKYQSVLTPSVILSAEGRGCVIFIVEPLNVLWALETAIGILCALIRRHDR
jgi:hypothetical protein